jgi:hypothetical protein
MKRLIMQVIRGESDPSELGEIGLTFRETESGFAMDEPAGLAIVEPSIDDLATGLFAHWVRSTGSQTWARVVLGGSFIDLRDLEDDPRGDVLLEMLWTLSDGEELTETDVDRLRNVVEE